MIPEITQRIGGRNRTSITPMVYMNLKTPYPLITEIIAMTPNNARKIVPINSVISFNVNTFSSFSSMNVVFETHISHFLTITNSNTKQDEPASDDTKVDPLPLNHVRTIVAMFDNIQHDAAPNCNQSPVPSIPYTKTLIIQHRLAKVCPSHSKLSALLIRVSLEPMT